jgi:oxygen-independent coproporphyrinogen-3 oxidase
VAGLYLHVPFRRARRPYDDSTYLVGGRPDVEQYRTALCRELRAEVRSHLVEEPMTTLYAGGGRPSLFPLPAVHALLRCLAAHLDLAGLTEATVEVSPADATARYVHGLRRMGVTRLSLEVLSFSSGVLHALDAPHSPDDARRALAHVQAAGFDTVSVDLLFGLPSQSVEAWTATLRQALAHDVPHITIQEAPADAPSSEGKRAEQMERAMTLLRSEGYEQYELTHFARPGHRSAHQENYYAHGNYVGAGPSAESFWWPDRLASGPARRWSNVGAPDRYARLLRRHHAPVASRQTLSRQALAREYILLRLRTDAGLDLDRLAAQYGVDLRDDHAALLGRLRDDGLIHDIPDRVRLTPRGRLLTDAITGRLLPA